MIFKIPSNPYYEVTQSNSESFLRNTDCHFFHIGRRWIGYLNSHIHISKPRDSSRMLSYNVRDQNRLIFNLITLFSADVQSSKNCGFGLIFQEHKGLSIVATCPETVQGSTLLQHDQVWKFFCRSNY